MGLPHTALCMTQDVVRYVKMQAGTERAAMSGDCAAHMHMHSVKGT